jgi:hypothetical protein
MSLPQSKAVPVGRLKFILRAVVLSVLLLQCCAAARPVATDAGEAPERQDGFGVAFAQAFAMIMVTELGDETFIIAALLAMRHPRLTVYAGAMGALTFMTVISTALGYVLPNLISPTATKHAATVLYTIFGARLFWIAYKSGKHEVKVLAARPPGCPPPRRGPGRLPLSAGCSAAATGCDRRRRSRRWSRSCRRPRLRPRPTGSACC